MRSRLHSGLASDEFPAILQRDETVLPRGRSGGRGDVYVHVENNGNQQVEVRQQDGPIDLKEVFIVINSEVASNISNHGSVARAIESNYGMRRPGRSV